MKQGLYDVSLRVLPNPPTCPPQQLCPVQGGNQRVAMECSCLTGETKRVQIRRHRFTYVDLHVQNVCIV